MVNLELLSIHNRYMEDCVNFAVSEGYVDENQTNHLRHLVIGCGVKKVLEIGFNGGASSSAFLSADPEVEVVSFDLGQWDYVLHASRLIRMCYGNRHTLVIGDSTETVPKYPISDRLFDLAFIDGGHIAPVPELDIKNVLPHVKPGGIIVMDDYCKAFGSQGVIFAWDHAVEQGWIKPMCTFHSGDRGWALGLKLKNDLSITSKDKERENAK